MAGSSETVPFMKAENDEDDSLEDHVDKLLESRLRKAKRWETCWALLAAVLLSCASASLGAWITSAMMSSNLDAVCLRRTSRPSPLTRNLEISYNTVHFNGSLLKENIYRQKGSPEVDEAWAALGVDYRSIVVPADQAERSGLAPDQVKISQQYGGGFPANVEGLHQLHCLNLVRQALYFNYDYYLAQGEGAFKNSEYILRKHVYIVRQQLMCTVDVGVMGQVWFQPSMSDFPEPYVDFNTPHVCRDFDAVRKWAEERQLPAETQKDFLEPPREGDRIYHTIP